MTAAERLHLEAKLAAALLREGELQTRWAVATHTSSGTDDPAALDVALAQARADVATLQERLAGAGAAEVPATAPAAAAPAAAPPAGFIDTAEAATLLGVSVKTLEALRARGSGPPWVKVGRRVRYEHARLIEWSRQR